MDKGTIKLIGFLLTIGVVFGAYTLIPKWHSRQVRKAAYERYAALGLPEGTRKIVDKYHDEIFEQCYKAGGRRTKANFDVDKYARLMDDKVEGYADQMLGDAVLEAAKKARTQAPPPAGGAARPAAPPTMAPTPVATATPASAETENPYDIRRLAAEHQSYSAAGHVFVVEVDVSSAVAPRPGAIRLSVACPDGGQFTWDNPDEIPSRPGESPSPGGRRATFRIAVADRVIGKSGGICELRALASDGSGGTGAEKTVFVVAR